MMGASVQPEVDPLEALKALKAQQDSDPLAQLKALKARNPSPADVAQRMAAANRRDQENLSDEQASQPGYLERFATHILNAGQGIPGVEALEAGAGALGSRFTGHPMGYRESLQTLRGATGQIPTAERVGEQVVGALPATPFLPAGAIKGGAAYGALQEALSATPNTPLERGVETGLGAGLGALSGAAGKAVGKAAQKVGLTDAIGRGLRRTAEGPFGGASALDLANVPTSRPGGLADLGEAIGTQGAANQVLDARQQILDRLQGSEKSAAQTMADHIDAYKAHANDFYAKAREANPLLMADPKIEPLVRHADLQPFFEEARAVTRNGANLTPGTTEVPRMAAGVPFEPPEVPSGAPTSLREALAAFKDRSVVAAQRNQGTTMQQIARGALERRAAEASLPSVTNLQSATLQEPVAAIAQTDVPTPEEVSLVKRTLDAIANRKIQQPGMSPLQARQLANQADALRDALHTASPEWRDADAYYSQAKNFETAFQKAFGVQGRVTESGLKPGKLKSPEAIDAYVSRASGPLQDVRRAGQAAGAASKIAEQVRNTPVGATPGEGLAGVLNPFSPSAAAQRAPAFQTPEDAVSFAQLLGRLAPDAGGGQPHAYLSTGLHGLHVAERAQGSGPLDTQAGRELRAALSAKLATDAGRRELLQQVIAARAGGRILNPLTKFLTAAPIAATAAKINTP